MTWQILCDSPETAVDVGIACEAIGLSSERHVVAADVMASAQQLLSSGAKVAIATSQHVALDAWVRLTDASSARETATPIAAAWMGGDSALDALRDIGIIAVHEVRPLVAVLALLNHAPADPAALDTRKLERTDATRLGNVVSTATTASLVRGDQGMLHVMAHARNGDTAQQVPVGSVPDVRAALDAIRGTSLGPRARVPRVHDVNLDSVRNIMLGPARALSDPASKAILAHYDLPMASAELCTTPSRAATEATRLGYPVRVTLASPDLRVWDHPDLVVDEVHSAAQVRDVFRQVFAVASARSASARLLGVTVSPATATTARLRLDLEPLSSGAVLAKVAWMHASNAWAHDATVAILPTTHEGVRRILSRLPGTHAWFGESPRDRALLIDNFGDVLLRLAAFVHDWRAYLTRVEVMPLALLPHGEFEVRQACVTVSDQFEEMLSTSHGL